METPKRNVRYLTSEEIIAINRRTILDFGGFTEGAGRLANFNSLEYLIDIVQAELSQGEIYSSLSRKAAVYIR
jgi:hypothetical protein